MKIFTTIILIVFLSSIKILSQSNIMLNLGYGNFLYNSENSLKIMDNKEFQTFLIYGFSLQTENYLNLNLMLNYNYHQTNKNNIIEREFIDEHSLVKTIYQGDLSINGHTIDIDYLIKANKFSEFGFGPTINFSNRTFDLYRQINIVRKKIIHDRLFGLGLGVNGIAKLKVALTESNKIFLNTILQLRYTKSIWFDEGIRNLDEYKQEFLLLQLLIGISYKL